jgi:hypothetical protein
MEVDRVSQMGGVGREATPSWPKNPARRRKFAEELPPAESDQDEEILVPQTSAEFEAEVGDLNPSEDDDGVISVLA